MILKAVLFDLAGTLVKAASPAEIIGRILEKYGVRRPIEDIALAHKMTEEDTSPEDYSLPYYDFWIKRNRRMLERLRVYRGIDFLARALVDEWWDNAGLEVYPDAEEALPRLRDAGLKLGIITNAFEKDIEDVLRRVRLPKLFDVLVGIDAVKRPKPHPEIFLYAVHVLNIKPWEALFIGDDLERDYMGALNAGLTAILIDRSPIRDSGGGPARIRSLNDVLTMLRGSGD